LASFRAPARPPRSSPSACGSLSCNELAIQLALAKLRRARRDLDVVALVIDARDSLGREMALEVDPERRVERIAGSEMIPTILMLVPRQIAHLGLRESHPRIAAGLAAPAPLGVVPVIAIAAEGVTLVHLPVVEPPPEVQA
jgi:hypothetical protein